jgi:3-phosphoglycerate kinase
MFTKQTIRDIDRDGKLQGKTVLLRAELDAPLSEDGRSVVSDFRLKSNLPTIEALLAADCKIVIIGKLGRPKGQVDLKMSLFPVAARLEKLLKHNVTFVTDCVGEPVRKAVARLEPGQIILLENLRFHPEEDQNNEKFAQALATDSGAELFVQDCFASVHHVGASIDAITHYLPSVAGLSLEKEVDTLTDVIQQPKRPLMAIIGGAKIADKLEVMQRFIEIADFVAVGGAMANTFLAARGVDVGNSLVDVSEIPIAKEMLKQAAAEAQKRQFVFAVPHDVVVAERIDKTAPTRIVELTTHTMADIEHYPGHVPASASVIHAHEQILDIGPFSASFIAGSAQLVSTVVWSGTMGVTETPSLHGPIGPTAHGTQTIIEALLGEFGHKPFTVVGGGDTVGYVQSRKLTEQFDHVSTGGGASLEVLAGHKLPGVEALLDK